MRRPWAVLLTVLALSALLVTGCSGGSSDSGSSGEAGGGAALDAAADGQGGAEAAAEAPGPVQPPADGRQVVTTGEVAVVVDDPRAAADEVTATLEALQAWARWGR